MTQRTDLFVILPVEIVRKRLDYRAADALVAAVEGLFTGPVDADGDPTYGGLQLQVGTAKKAAYVTADVGAGARRQGLDASYAPDAESDSDLWAGWIGDVGCDIHREGRQLFDQRLKNKQSAPP